MDTFWYAIDREGRIGRFDSWENGHVPQGIQEATVLWDVWDATHGRDSRSSMDDTDIAAQLGFFLYEYGDQYDPIQPYARIVNPENPIHIDQLPPALREICRRVRFDRVSFADRPLLQPLEYFACEYLYGDDRFAYLCSDGITVRPLPGMEEEFPEFCRSFRELYPDEAEELRFEGIDEAPPQGEP